MKTTNPKATKTVYPIICQIVNTIPTQFIAETAKAHKVLSRTFSPKSHVAAMLYCQVSKTESLNSICDVARANDALWRSMGSGRVKYVFASRGKCEKSFSEAFVEHKRG